MVAIALAASPADAQSGTARSYEGSAGSTQIVLTLEDEGTDEEAWGRYFYRSTRRDIALQGTRSGDSLTLDARFTGDRLQLRRQGDTLVGTLTTGAKRRLPVRLTRVTTAAGVPAEATTDLSLHEKLQLAGLRFEPGATEVIDGKPIRWLSEAKSGVRLFRLAGGYPAQPMAAMNAALARNQWRDVRHSLACTSSDGGAGVIQDVEGKPWLTAEYVSYRVEAAWDCAGAAHPDFGVSGYSFDARSGRELRLDEVLPAGTQPVPAESSDGWYAYRSEVFAPAVVTLLRRTHAAEMKPVDPEGEDCNYSDPEVWSFPSWQLTRDGLWLGASFARVQRVCDNPDWSVIPWSALKKPAPAAR
ncbi:hypothetical protein ACBY01_11590 [Sphingomonas sp. ac-8]|uniref:hypothetical protein n=1 Tax=Sphingomonas sp. ac-8 TaxID=3242977 RepID=UPI003A7FB53D